MQPSEFVFKFHASETRRQKVTAKPLIIFPDVPFTVEACRTFGNQHLRLHAEPGPLKVQYSALVDINHILVPPDQLAEVPISKLPVNVMHYLHPSRYCPSDRFYQIALQEFGHLSPGYGRVQAICEWVRDRTRFQPGTTNSFHCAIDTLNNKIGVCRDFAHLMISVCRALNIPARYVTSIDYGADPALGPMDFHAYVEVYLSGRWYIFDPTGICPKKTGLVRIATGRDANDVAFATIFGSVMWSIPRINMTALEDPAAGITLPANTDMAVSTSGPSDKRQVVTSSARLDGMMLKPPLPTFSSLAQEKPRATA